MSILGIGPRLAIIGVTALIVILAIEHLAGFTLSLPMQWSHWGRSLGLLLIVLGLILWLSSIPVLKKAYDAHRLATKGVYRISQNPLYAAFIVLIVPGLAFVLNNLFVLLVAICLFIGFMRLIPREEEYLHREFGEEYDAYVKRVGRLIPFIHG